jgi:glycosyltransferase involved in cell wall biosynthesis
MSAGGPRVALLVSGPPACAMGERARAFAKRLAGRFQVTVAYRGPTRVTGMLRLALALARGRPDVVYVLDVSAAGVLAAVAYELLARKPLVLDTGDAAYALARSSGLRGRLGLALTFALEELALRAADAIVVRGTMHREVLTRLGKPVEVVQDGVEVATFGPRDGRTVRESLGLAGKIVLGVVGSSVWSPRLRICYGWDLVEAVALLDDLPVAGLVVGDGTGIAHLQERCRELGIEDRVRFVPRVPYDDLPRYLGAMDVCLSTQTNDLPGRVRTTGKLPLYLAAGRCVLASDVGEAALVLKASMRVPYEGVVDRAYPARLAARIRALAKSPGAFGTRDDLVQLARERFDYDVLAPRVAALLDRVAPR